jgi:deoxyribodipyrimidine photolyase-like uncharacterized protein
VAAVTDTLLDRFPAGSRWTFHDKTRAANKHDWFQDRPVTIIAADDDGEQLIVQFDPGVQDNWGPIDDKYWSAFPRQLLPNPT